MPDADKIKRLTCPPEKSDCTIDLSSQTPADLVRWIASQLGLRYNEQGDKAFLGLPRPNPRPTEAKPAAVNAVGSVVYPSGSVAERHPSNNVAEYAPAHPSSASPLVKASPDIQVSKHFRLSEFRPKSDDYSGVRVHPKLVALLERIREAAGCPIRITSGYRPPAYNRAVGGVPTSNHQDGTAADIYADKLSTSQLRAVCEQVLGKSGGLGYYPGQQFCHLDIGPYARWEG